jgi:hypothetical protein
MAGVVLANLVFYARWYEWWGGGIWGPRFMVPVLPFIALGIPAVLVRARGVAGRWLIGALATVSFAIQVLSVILPVNTYFLEMNVSRDLFQRYLFDPADSPILAAIRTAISGNYAPELAPFDYHSSTLAALQWAALAVALGLMGSIFWALAREASRSLPAAKASPPVSGEVAAPDEPDVRARRRLTV